MSHFFKGHLTLVSLGLLAATSSAPAAAVTQADVRSVSPTAHRLQLALESLKLSTMPKMEKLNLPHGDLPKQPQGGAPAGPSKKLTPPSPNQLSQKTLNPKTNFVAFNDPKYGLLQVTPEARAAYLSLPPSVRTQLTDPKGGALVSAAALQKLATHFRGFKPPKNNPPAGAPCGPPGTAGAYLVSDGNGGCVIGTGGSVW
jgi:hypothetical protein